MQTAAVKQHILSNAPRSSPREHAPQSYGSSSSSWSSIDGLSTALGPPKPPLAWASVRYQVIKSTVEEDVEDAEQISELYRGERREWLTRSYWTVSACGAHDVSPPGA
jgi:hypothetical protein